jgi:hypothetical protein
MTCVRSGETYLSKRITDECFALHHFDSWLFVFRQDLECLSLPLPSEEDPRLLFAGEATETRFWSTMHGARLSGLRGGGNQCKSRRFCQL